MKTMCPPGYYHNGFMATHDVRHMMYIIHYAHLAFVRLEYSVCLFFLPRISVFIYLYIPSDCPF